MKTALLLFFRISLFSASISLVNDSKYPLIAAIYDIRGVFSFEKALEPAGTYIWTIGENPFNPAPNATYTPFTVVWICNTEDRAYDYNTAPQEEGEKKPPDYASSFGVWTGIGPGATVNAMGSPTGSKTCVVKKKKPSDKTEKELLQKEREEDWQNDYGDPWVNDGGSPFHEYDGNN